MLWRNGGGGGGSGPRGNPFNSNPSLDLSEFPSLTNRDSAANINPMSGRTPYGEFISLVLYDTYLFEVNDTILCSVLHPPRY